MYKGRDMQTIPAHIEDYMRDAGFSQTGVLVIRRLMSGEQLTIRELAAKTGKSTGLLDQAVKKLLEMKILTRSMVNDNPRYGITSLEELKRWMKGDMEEKWRALERREQDFDSFMSSLTATMSHPEVSTFEGLEGFRKVYGRLVEEGSEFLDFFPVESSTVDDQRTSEFLSDITKRRRQLGVSSRVIAHNTPMGRKYQSRDHLTFRKTVLIPEREYVSSFEKIVVGDYIACIDWGSQRATLIHHPEFAKAERHTFEVIWNTMIQKEADEASAREERRIAETERETLPISFAARITRFLPSRVREFLKSCGILPREWVVNENATVVRIEIHTVDRPALVYDVVKPFALRHVNIAKLIFFGLAPKQVLIDMTFEAHSLEEMSYLIDELQALPGVINVTRK